MISLGSMKKTIIFDLDGTLVDVQPVFLRIVNQLSAEFHYATLMPEELPALKDLPLRNFIFNRLGWRFFLFPKIIKRGREEYHQLVPEVELFPGIVEIFSALRDRGYRIGIVSSSKEETVRALLQKFGLSVDFIAHSNLFGKARVLKKTLRERSLTAAETIYVGDEVRDVEACRKAGIRIIAVTWGLNSKEALERAGAQTVDTRGALLEQLTA